MLQSQSTSALPLIQVWLMGEWRILHRGAPLDIPAGQPRALLIYLLLQPECTAARATLVETLWPAAPPERGRRYLTDALYRLRRALAPVQILADNERIALDLTYEWWVDVWAFRTGAASNDLETLTTCLGLFAPTLAEDVTEPWVLGPRAQIQEQFVQVALRVAEAAVAAADYMRAETAYRQALATDPLLESAHRGLMRSLAFTGRLAAALEHYDGLVELLEQEVAAPPSPATRELAEQLFQELDLAHQRAQARPTRRLVGRVEERAALRSALDRARAGHAGLVVLLGAPGIGKTILLRDLAQAADWRGWQIHWGRGVDDRAPDPYAPLTAALCSALPEPRAAQLATSLPSIWVDLLARFLPPFRQRSTEGLAWLPPAALEAHRLPHALAQLLAALQNVAPLLLLLDDVHWGDPTFWPLLNELMPLVRQQHLLLVLSSRREELQANPAAWAQLEAWDRDAVAQVIALGGLPPPALDELAALHYAEAAAKDPSAPPASAHAITLHTASGGNPLLALEILSAGAPQELLTVRPALATLAAQRLQRLSAPARQAAALAALLGPQVRYAHWAALWQVENPYSEGLHTHAAELERAGVLLIERERYAFAHDILHVAALADMDSSARQRRHAAALAILVAEEAAEPQRADTSLLLYHAHGAQNRTAVARYAMRAGEQALAAFVFSGAEAHFTLTLAHLPADAVAERYSALLGRIQARHMLADRSGESADLDAIRAMPLTPAQALTVSTHLAEYQLVVGDLAAAQATIEQALPFAATMVADNAAALHLVAGRVARDQDRPTDAQAHIARAQALYELAGNRWGMALTTDLLGGLAWDRGDYSRSTALHAQAADIFQALGDLAREAQSLNNLGSAYWELGRYADARSTHERSILVCRELGNKLSEGDNIDNLGGVAWALGDYDLAIRQYKTALALRESIADAWGVAISLSNLGSAYRMLGRHEEALDYYARSLPLCQAIGRKRNEAYVIHGQGQTLLAMGRVDEAWARLEEALAMRSEIGDRTRLIETHIAMIHAALKRNDTVRAVARRDATLELLRATDPASLRQEAYLAASVLDEHLGQTEAAARKVALALTAQAELAAVLPPADRARFLENVPLNRELAMAAERYTVTQRVTLAHGAAPINVRWTLAAPADRLIDDEARRRRHVLARLLHEARAAGGVPTHNQLAAALGVSRRTILRDLATIAATSV